MGKSHKRLRRARLKVSLIYEEKHVYLCVSVMGNFFVVVQPYGRVFKTSPRGPPDIPLYSTASTPDSTCQLIIKPLNRWIGWASSGLEQNCVKRLGKMFENHCSRLSPLASSEVWNIGHFSTMDSARLTARDCRAECCKWVHCNFTALIALK